MNLYLFSVSTRVLPPLANKTSSGKVETSIQFGLKFDQASKVVSSKEHIENVGRVEYNYQVNIKTISSIII